MRRSMKILDCLKATLLLIGLLLNACGGSTPSPSTSTGPQPTATTAHSPSPQTEFEKDLQYIRNGQYTYVWIFSRKDGKPLDSTDSAFLRTNAPQVVDWVTTEGG